MTTGAAFLGEKCFVWQWRLVNLSDFAYHKCIHLNVDVEWSIWNTFEIAGIFWEGFFIASHIDWPLGLFPSIHQLTPTPVTGPAPRSLQGIITAEVADHSLSRLGCLEPKKKCWSQNEEFLTDVFVQFVSPKPYFSKFCHEDVLKTNWRIQNISLQFRFETLSYVNPFVQKPLKCMGHVRFEFLDDEFGGGLFFVVVPRWKGWVKPQVVWSYKGDSVTAMFQFKSLRSQFDGMFFMSTVAD